MAEKTLPIIAGDGDNLPAPFLDKTIIVAKSGNGIDMHYDENGDRYSLFRFPSGFKAGGLGEILPGTDISGKTVLEVLMDAIGQSIKIVVLPWGGIVSVSGSGDYKKGTTVTVSCVAQSGEIFDGWYDENFVRISDSQTWSFTAERDRTLTAAIMGMEPSTEEPETPEPPGEEEPIYPENN
jgi:hypothetical protein